MRCLICALALAGAVSTSAQADFLVDNGSQPTGSGRTVSGDAVAGGWKVFQRVTISDAAWHITSVGVDGWSVADPLGLGMTGSIIGSDEFGNPNDKDVRATGSFFLGSDAFSSNWQYDEFDVTLDTGTYWVMWSDSGDTGFWSAIFLGTSGEASLSYSGGSFFDGPATALRIEGTVVPVPGALAAFGLMGLGLRRRRR